jgi:pimeloyl-ACP methyl ester carboxylesterase/DNA-binding CsgD family transcriptional regulator
MQQTIRFCRSGDGTRIAYAVHGSGPPLVKGSHWLTHLEKDWDSPVWRHWLEELGRHHTVIRYDERGCGLSDRDVPEISLDASVNDLEAVVDAAGLEKFALFGMSASGAASIAYAAQHPEQVSHLVIYGAYGRGVARRGDPAALAEAELLISSIRVGWGNPNHAFRHVFVDLFLPEGSDEQADWYVDLQRHSASPETAAMLRQSRLDVDVEDLAGTLEVPTLVLHARDDAIVPFEEGRRLASLIANARFVPLEGCNHILLAGEPAWEVFVAEVREFLKAGAGSESDDRLESLSQREKDVLRLVARGQSNAEIAVALSLSERTVERHLSNIYSKLALLGKAARAGAAALFSRSDD